MIKRSKHIALSALMAVAFLFGYAQSKMDSAAVIKELQLMSKLLSESKALYTDMSYKMYKDPRAKTPMEELKGFYIKRGNDYKFQLGPQILLQNKEAFLVIDDASEVIVVSNTQDMPSTEAMSVDAEFVRKHLKRLWVLKETDKIVRVKFTLQSGNYKQVIMEIDKQKHIPVNVILDYATPLNISEDYRKEELIYPRLEISYTNYTLDKTLSSSAFSLTPYLSKKNGSYTATTRYTHYRILDQRN